MEDNIVGEEMNGKLKLDETADSDLEANKEEFKEQSNNNEIDELKDRCQILKADYDEMTNKYFRISADFQNYKKRMEKEKSDICNFANEKLILELIPIVDNLERAVKSSNDEGQGECILKGVEMIYHQFMDTLQKNGVKEISSEGKTFDPKYHHAVMQVEDPAYEGNMVIEVFQKGYMLYEKVIRPSMVKVSN